MPIYEYYCSTCDARFSHLARTFDPPPPPCPGCGSTEAKRLISRVNQGRSETDRQAAYETQARELNPDDPQALARFLQERGGLADEVAPVEAEAFREIVERRAKGAGDEELQDVVDELPFPRQGFQGTIPLPEYDGPAPGEHTCHHHHEHMCDHGQGEERCEEQPRPKERGDRSRKKRNPRKARDLGWA